MMIMDVKVGRGTIILPLHTLVLWVDMRERQVKWTMIRMTLFKDRSEEWI